MTRKSDNVFNCEGRLMDGFDYENQAWVKGGRYIGCGHPPNTCRCYGRVHEAEMTPIPSDTGVLDNFFNGLIAK